MAIRQTCVLDGRRAGGRTDEDERHEGRSAEGTSLVIEARSQEKAGQDAGHVPDEAGAGYEQGGQQERYEGPQERGQHEGPDLQAGVLSTCADVWAWEHTRPLQHRELVPMSSSEHR